MEASNSNQPSGTSETQNDEFYCTLCNVKNNNTGNYNSHITSKKHLRRTKLAQQAVNKLPIQENTVSNFDVGEGDMDDTKFCKVCTKHLQNQESAVAHYRSKKHKHKLSIIEKTWQSECIPCKKTFSGEQQWKQHVESAKHVKMTSAEDKISFSFDFDLGDDELETTIAEKVLKDSSCDLCAKKFSGTKPIHDHFKSKEHVKKLQMAKKLKSDLAELGKRKYGGGDDSEIQIPRKQQNLTTD